MILLYILLEGNIMYEFECLTIEQNSEMDYTEKCPPFLGECYPVIEGCCGPECNPMDF